MFKQNGRQGSKHFTHCSVARHDYKFEASHWSTVHLHS